MSVRDVAREFEAEAMPHMNELYRTAVRLTLNRGEAEDLVQEVFLQAWKSYGRYEAGTNCRAWLFKILFHKLDHHRRRKYAQWKHTVEGDDLIAETARYEPPVPQHLTDENVLGALDRLPERQREIVLLADVEEFSYREIAEVLGVPIGTVMSRLSRARAQLRRLLAEVAPEIRHEGAAYTPVGVRGP
ncbi:MAG: sigma-70 family RNA polymerase sigma factor, partial [Acidobacteriota bacterium]|nr:sigma-70 family RNA polymerase sigma factor [Acidobacteriota bacterium]